MNWTESKLRFQHQTLWIGRSCRSASHSRGSGCTSRKIAFQPGFRWIACEVHWAFTAVVNPVSNTRKHASFVPNMVDRGMAPRIRGQELWKVRASPLDTERRNVMFYSSNLIK